VTASTVAVALAVGVTSQRLVHEFTTGSIHAELAEGRLPLLVASAALLWSAIEQTRRLIAERFAVTELSDLEPVLPDSLVDGVRSDLRFHRAWSWVRRRLHRPPLPPRAWPPQLSDTGKKRIVDENRRRYDERLANYVAENPGSILVRGLTAVSPRLRFTAIFFYGLSMSLLWVINRGPDGPVLIALINWLTPFAFGEFAVMAEYALEGRPRSLPPRSFKLRALVLNLGLLGLLLLAYWQIGMLAAVALVALFLTLAIIGSKLAAEVASKARGVYEERVDELTRDPEWLSRSQLGRRLSADEERRRRRLTANDAAVE
jgi:hypothetical protein